MYPTVLVICAFLLAALVVRAVVVQHMPQVRRVPARIINRRRPSQGDR